MLHLMKEEKIAESKSLLGEKAVDMLQKVFLDSIRVVEEVGFKCPVEAVRKILEDTGMAAYDPSTGHVHILPELVEESLKNTVKNDKFWLPKTSFGIGGTAAYLKDDKTNELIEAKEEHIRELAKLVEETDVISFSGRGAKLYGRNRDAIKILTENTGKTIYFGTDTKEDVDLAESIHKDRGKILIIWDIIQSPLEFYEHMAEAFLHCIKKGLPVKLASMPLAGVSAPYSMTGLLTLAYAEFLAGLVIVQTVSPGNLVLSACYPNVSDIRKKYMLDFSCSHFNMANSLVSHISGMLDIPSCQSGCTTNQKNLNEEALRDSKRGYSLYKKYGGHMVRHAFGFTKDTLAFSLEKARRAAEVLRNTTAEDAPPYEIPPYDPEAFDAIARNSSKANYINDPHTLKNTGKEFVI